MAWAARSRPSRSRAATPANGGPVARIWRNGRSQRRTWKPAAAKASATATSNGELQLEPAPCAITRPLRDASRGSCSQPRIISRSKRFIRNLTLAPDGLSPDAGPPRNFEVGQELCEVSLIFADADDAAERMRLPRGAADAFCIHRNYVAAGHNDSPCAIAKGFEIEVQRPVPIHLAKDADAVADACEEHAEIGTLAPFELGGSEKFDSHAGRGGALTVKRQPQKIRSADRFDFDRVDPTQGPRENI